ncbi:7372_t:CDS:2, partial [Rhizophagus irregularis]
WMLKQVEAGERTQDLKMSILQAIQYIIQDFPLDDHEVSDELANALKTLNFSDMMELKEFFNIPEENMVYEILQLMMMKLLQKL